MSAPALATPAAMPTMVSRLPKFASRPKCAPPSGAGPAASGATSSRLTNGFYHHPGPGGGAFSEPPSSVRNGFIRVPTSFSMKWKERNEPMEDGGANAEKEWRRGKGANGQNQSTNNPPPPPREQTAPASQHEAKSTEKGRGFCQPSCPCPHSSPRTPAAKSRLRTGPKQTPNAPSGSKPHSFARPRAAGPRSGPASPSGSLLGKKAPASRSLSTDSLRAAPSPVRLLTESDRLRSRSLTQVRQSPSPPLAASSSSSLPRRRGAGAGRGFRVHNSAAPGKSGLSTPTVLPPSALKKPLLPGLGPASKPSGISYKLSRPSLIKQSRPLRVISTHGREQEVMGAVSQRRNSLETPSTENSAAGSGSSDVSPEAPETEGLSAETASQRELSIVGETLEDMSLSSTSSLDRDDTSQEYLDDFDNLGNGGGGTLLLSSKNEDNDSGLERCARFDDDKVAVNGVAEATGLCFLDDGLDWAGVALSGETGDHRPPRLSHQRTSDVHEQGGSSLDLSPSDSCGSGGTYMWDEEGLEPLGGAVTSTSINTNSTATHHVGSFDSDFNSNDVLSNLDTGDLDDDDLMLDVDFPEDTSLHSDIDGMSHMAQWRMRQLCWGTQDVHSDQDSDFHCYKLSEDPGNKRTESCSRNGDLILDLCPTRTSWLSPSSPGPGLGLDVEELAEECCAVRSQLEHLHRFLLQADDADDDTLTNDTLSPETDESPQVQALQQEVQQLRDELRSRDRTIQRLSLQLQFPSATTRCRCQTTAGSSDQNTQTSETERESVSVASQTPWREPTYQRSRPYRLRPKPSIPSHLARKREEHLVMYFSDTACHRYFTPPSRTTRRH